MSPRPLRPCSHHGCAVLLRAGTACPMHPTQLPRRVDPEQTRYYGSSAWKALRAKVRQQEPMCRLCQKARSTNVDHIDGNWRNDQRSNLRALCTPCERSRTSHQHTHKRITPTHTSQSKTRHHLPAVHAHKAEDNTTDDIRYVWA